MQWNNRRSEFQEMRKSNNTKVQKKISAVFFEYIHIHKLKALQFILWHLQK